MARPSLRAEHPTIPLHLRRVHMSALLVTPLTAPLTQAWSNDP
jgi:hypothetical protein